MHTLRAASLLFPELASADDRGNRIHLAAITFPHGSKLVELKPQQQGVYSDTIRWNLPGPLPTAAVDRPSAGLLSPPLIGPLPSAVPVFRSGRPPAVQSWATSVIAWRQEATNLDVRRLRVYADSTMRRHDDSHPPTTSQNRVASLQFPAL
jgi:hypothetical protein